MTLSKATLAKMTTRQILETAIEVSGFSNRAFTRHVLNVHERTGRRWNSGESPFEGTPLALCLAIIERPALAQEIHDRVAAYRLARKAVDE